MSLKSFYLIASILLINMHLFGQSFTDYDSRKIDSFKYALLSEDLNLNDSILAIHSKSILYGQNLKDSAVLLRDMGLLMKYTNFIDSFNRVTNSACTLLSKEKAIFRGIEWFELSKNRDDFQTLSSTVEDLELEHLLRKTKTENSLVLSKPQMRGGTAIEMNTTSSSNISSSKLIVTNETDEIIYIYVDGVYHTKVYSGKTEPINPASGCSFFEAENRLGSIGKRSICFASKKNYNWALKKSNN